MKQQYQKNFSKINQSVLDPKIRKIKAKKILTTIKDFLNKKNQKLTGAICLDIGGSAGFCAKSLSPFVKKIYVIDIDENALKYGKINNKTPNIIYKVGDAMFLPFANNSIDIIICNQVYEHVPDSHQLFKEIYRVLKPKGMCYFGAGNRFVLVEQHYNLPFLSWFPKKVSNIYIRLFRKEKFYYENLLSFFGLKRLLKNFNIYDYTINVIKNPVQFSATDLVKKNSFISNLPRIFLKLIEPIFPGYIFIIQKK